MPHFPGFGCPNRKIPDLPFLAFLERARKTTQKSKDPFSVLNPENSWERREQRPKKARKFLATKKQENPKKQGNQALPRRRLVRRRVVSGDGVHVSATFSRPERRRTAQSLTEIDLVLVFQCFLKRSLVAAPLPLTHPKNLFGLFLTFRVISNLQGYF